MRIASQSPTELVVKDSTIWVSTLCAAAAFAIIFFSIAQSKPNGFFVAAFFLLFAIVFARNTVFTFDGIQRVVRWNGYKPFKRVSGTIPFDEITDITVEASTGGNNVSTYRLSLQTAKGATPLAFNYSGSSDGYASVRSEILAFIRPGLSPAAPPPQSPEGIPADLESSIRSLLQQGRKIDAIALLRSGQRMSLKAAKDRIEAVTKRMTGAPQ